MIDQPPVTTEPELAAYLVRRLTWLEGRSKGYLAPENVIPTKPQPGRIYYFNKTILPEITEPGFWGYDTTWINLNVQAAP